MLRNMATLSKIYYEHQNTFSQHGFGLPIDGLPPSQDFIYAGTNYEHKHN